MTYRPVRLERGEPRRLIHPAPGLGPRDGRLSTRLPHEENAPRSWAAELARCPGLKIVISLVDSRNRRCPVGSPVSCRVVTGLDGSDPVYLCDVAHAV